MSNKCPDMDVADDFYQKLKGTRPDEFRLRSELFDRFWRLEYDFDYDCCVKFVSNLSREHVIHFLNLDTLELCEEINKGLASV